MEEDCWSEFSDENSLSDYLSDDCEFDDQEQNSSQKEEQISNSKEEINSEEKLCKTCNKILPQNTAKQRNKKFCSAKCYEDRKKGNNNNNGGDNDENSKCCLTCNKILPQRTYQEKQAKYCNIECYENRNINKGNDIEKYCLTCNKPLPQRTYQQRRAKYCNAECFNNGKMKEISKLGVEARNRNRIEQRKDDNPNLIKDTPKICQICNITFLSKRSNTKVCSVACSKLLTKKRAAEGFFKKIGSDGGKISAAITVKRSKNEIYFAELCAKHWEIKTNEPMFDGWDADVIIPSLRIAIFWNGIWHYQQVRKNHNLQQVQTRDKVKEDIITKKYGYTVYIIKDMGGENKKFVEKQFKQFYDYLYFT